MLNFQVEHDENVTCYFFRPNGRIDVIVTVPDEPMTWVMSGFGISKDYGFGVLHTPSRVSSMSFNLSYVYDS